MRWSGEATLRVQTSVAAASLDLVLAQIDGLLGAAATAEPGEAELRALQLRRARQYGRRFSTVESAADHLLDLEARGIEAGGQLSRDALRWAAADKPAVGRLLRVCRQAPQLVLVGPKAVTDRALAKTSFSPHP